MSDANIDRLADVIGTFLNRAAQQPVTVWATLREDTYETLFGDGYYAYLDKVFDSPIAALGRSNEPRGDWVKLHVRRYEISVSSKQPVLSPEPSESEPVTVKDVVEKMLRAGII
ncbi:hypothetical protein [Brevundimonas sp. Root608]|nr:hypothetical protein [Brevundimonas sp. Root608]KQY95032.1 hypothetical protein ASD25_17080 [Brevundimonas sp. Root1423]KRA28518.1 hypothetical protein ASD59_01420 [Brevundimonas sp. Root608]